MNARTLLRLSAVVAAAAGLALAPFAQTPAQQGQGRGYDRQTEKKPRPKPEPAMPSCECYFSGDCPLGNTCYWGPNGPFVEDHCEWALPKPSGQVGQGCTGETELPGGCDGLCTGALNGSIPGSEEPVLVAVAVDLWSLAFLGPASQGGGPVDPEIAEAVFALPFENPLTPEILGRMVGSVFVIGAGQGFFYPDPALGIPAGHCAPGITLHWVSDLSGAEAWRLDVLRNMVALLQAEMSTDPGTAAHALERVAACTPDPSAAFQPVCVGEEALPCVRGRLHDLAMSLVTPVHGKR